MEIKIEKVIKEPTENELKIEDFKGIHHSLFMKEESFHSLNCEIESWNKENNLLFSDNTKVTEDNLDHIFHCLHEANMPEVNSEKLHPLDSNGEMQLLRSPKTETYKKKQVKLTKKKFEPIQDSSGKSIISQRSSKDFAPSKRRKQVCADGLSLENKRTSRSMTPEVEDDGSVLDKKEGIINTKATRSITPKVSKKYDDLKSGTSIKKLLSVNKTQNLTNFQSKLLEKFDTSRFTEEDTDKMFLLSLLPYVNKLNDDARLNFRVYTLQFFQDGRTKSRH